MINLIMKNKGTSIVLEGLPCAGKTTIGTILSEKYDCNFIGTIGFLEHIRLKHENKKIKNELEDIKIEVHNIEKNKNSFSTNEIDELFLNLDIKKEKIINSFIEERENVIMERNHATTLAYSYCYSKMNDNDRFSNILSKYLSKKKDFLEPDIYIYLSIDRETSQHRQKTRKPAIIGSEWGNIDFIKNFHDFYKFFVKDYETNSILYEVNNEGNLENSLDDIEVLLKNK